MSKKVKIEFDEKHLPTIMAALEVYTRMKSGQVSIALNYISPQILGWNDSKEIENLVKEKCFPSLTQNSYHGIGAKEMGDAKVAYEIKKVIEEYISVKNNNGYWGFGCNFDGPCVNFSNIPFPTIENFNKYIDTPLGKRYYKKIKKLITEKNYESAWEFIDKLVEGKLPKYDSAEVVEVPESGQFVIRCYKPRKDK